MTLPENPELNEFLNSVRIRTEHGTSDSFEIGIERILSDSSDAPHVAEPITFSYASECRVSLVSMLGRIKEELVRLDHHASDEIAKVFLGISCLVSKTQISSIESLNRVLSHIVTSSCSAFWVFPFPPHPSEVTSRLEAIKLANSIVNASYIGANESIVTTLIDIRSIFRTVFQ